MNELAIIFRSAIPEDIPDIARLMGELGYPNTSDFFHRKLDRMAFSDIDFIILAEVEGEKVGVAHLHIAEMLHYPGKLGRVMAIVVGENYRGLGIGGEMMSHLETVAKEKDCSLIEITSNIKREDTHRFYESLGYEEKRKRFIKELD